MKAVIKTEKRKLLAEWFRKEYLYVVTTQTGRQSSSGALAHGEFTETIWDYRAKKKKKKSENKDSQI